jgi:hypothetical protein
VQRVSSDSAAGLSGGGDRGSDATAAGVNRARSFGCAFERSPKFVCVMGIARF